MRYIIDFSVLLCLTLFSIACRSIAANEVYPYSPEKISLCGEVLSDIRYGPPNYGETPETDVKLTVYKLKLKQSITVGTSDSLSEVNTDIFKDIIEVQLVSTNHGSMNSLLGKNVVIRGELEQAVSGEDFLPVILVVDSVIENQ